MLMMPAVHKMMTKTGISSQMEHAHRATRRSLTLSKRWHTSAVSLHEMCGGHPNQITSGDHARQKAACLATWCDEALMQMNKGEDYIATGLPTRVNAILEMGMQSKK